MIIYKKANQFVNQSIESHHRSECPNTCFNISYGHTKQNNIQTKLKNQSIFTTSACSSISLSNIFFKSFFFPPNCLTNRANFASVDFICKSRRNCSNSFCLEQNHSTKV